MLNLKSGGAGPFWLGAMGHITAYVGWPVRTGNRQTGINKIRDPPRHDEQDDQKHSSVPASGRTGRLRGRTVHGCTGDMRCETDVRQAAEEEEVKRMPIIMPPTIPWRRWRADDRDARLLGPILNWEQKVVLVLDMVRRRELTECNPKC